MLNIGHTAPDFSQTDQHGEMLSLADLLEPAQGGGKFILYFYPADFTPVCTAQACMFRDSFSELQGAGVRIVGVSPQGRDSHERFSDSFELPFSLLCDPDKKMVKSFGVDGPMGFGVRRVTYLIGQDRLIKNRAVADIFLGDHNALVKSVLAQ